MADSFRAHLSPLILQQRSHNTELSVIPGEMTSMLQPLDAAVSKPYKECTRKKWPEWILAGQHLKLRRRSQTSLSRRHLGRAGKQMPWIVAKITNSSTIVPHNTLQLTSPTVTRLKNRWLAENAFQRRVRKTINADLLRGLKATHNGANGTMYTLLMLVYEILSFTQAVLSVFAVLLTGI